MNSINKIIKSYAIESNLSDSMISKIDLILDLFDEVLIISDKKQYKKIVNSISKIFSDHSKDDNHIKDFKYYFVDYNDSDIKFFLRFLSCFFHLLNQCEMEEINHRNNLKSKQANLTNPVKDSISDAIKFLKDNNIPVNEAEKTLDEILFEPTLTSHPTEFRRISLLVKQNKILNNINHYLFKENNGIIKTYLKKEIKNQIFIFMNTDDHRKINISPKDEIKNSIFLMFNSAWESIPMIFNDLRQSFKNYYNKEYEFKKNINFCTWIGGDRDGNPNITSNTTSWALKFQRIQILNRYIISIDRLFHELSLARKKDEQFEKDIKKDLKKTKISKTEVLRYKNETIRFKLLLIKNKLEKTLSQIQNNKISIDYDYMKFEKDLIIIKKHMKDNYPINLFNNSSLENLIIRSKTFQFNLMQLDIRQHSDFHGDFIDNLLKIDYNQMTEKQKKRKMVNLLQSNKKLINKNQLNTASMEMYDTFKVIIQNLIHHPSSIKSYIVSMTHGTSDILEVLFIFQQIKIDIGVEKELILNITPLYETIYDLNNANNLLTDLLNCSIYKSHLEKANSYQEIMLGYSDSNKDGGIFMANYSIHTCMKKINTIFMEHKINYSIFHGRGGSISRGGGKSNEAIRSFPSFSSNQKLRMTEQGEIISYRYGNKEISKRHLEQILSALIKNSLKSIEEDNTLNEIMLIADSTFKNYNAKIKNLEFWKFFIKSTPINYISKLKISSRPFSRSKIFLNKTGFDEIRAIPWVSSWVQTRYNISGWFGIGMQIDELIKSGNLKSLQKLYQKSSFFRNIMDNITFEMARARLPISKKYSKICNYENINNIIQEEFKLIKKGYLLISNRKSLLDRNPVIENLIKFRNPPTDLLNIIQIEYLRKISNNKTKSNTNNEIIISSINGIAAAMQTTG